MLSIPLKIRTYKTTYNSSYNASYNTLLILLQSNTHYKTKV